MSMGSYSIIEIAVGATKYSNCHQDASKEVSSSLIRLVSFDSHLN